MTASDAHPPSDTGATGWHMHPSGTWAHRDIGSCVPVELHPVLVVDPVEARETIARVLCFGRDDSEVAGWWDRLPDFERNRHLDRADAVLAALTHSEGTS